MTQRSIFSGKEPQVVVRAGGSVVVKGWEEERVLAESSGIWGLQVKRKKGKIEVQLGGSGQVFAPAGSSLVVYAGKSAEIEAIHGATSVYAGLDARIRQGDVLAQLSAGRNVEIDCSRVAGRSLKFNAGRDLRCQIRDLKNVRYLINDLGGKWQIAFGDASTTIQLVAGGDVTLVTDQEIVPQPPDFVLGKIERPAQGSA